MGVRSLEVETPAHSTKRASRKVVSHAFLNGRLDVEPGKRRASREATHFGGDARPGWEAFAVMGVTECTFRSGGQKRPGRDMRRVNRSRQWA